MSAGDMRLVPVVQVSMDVVRGVQVEKLWNDVLVISVQNEPVTVNCKNRTTSSQTKELI
jgi:hypothetical protein